MSERNLVRRITGAARRAGAHVQRIEDAVSAGVPDINLCHHGRETWIEAKWIARWPARPTTPVRTCLTERQALWLADRAGAGGHCYVWLQAEREHLLFDAEGARELLLGLPRLELEHAALCEGFEDCLRMVLGRSPYI